MPKKKSQVARKPSNEITEQDRFKSDKSDGRTLAHRKGIAQLKASRPRAQRPEISENPTHLLLDLKRRLGEEEVDFDRAGALLDEGYSLLEFLKQEVVTSRTSGNSTGLKEARSNIQILRELLQSFGSAQPTSMRNEHKPLQRAKALQTAILDALFNLGVDARAVPTQKPGQPGVRKQVFEHLRLSRPGATDHTLKKAWQALRSMGEIRDA